MTRTEIEGRPKRRGLHQLAGPTGAAAERVPIVMVFVAVTLAIASAVHLSTQPGTGPFQTDRAGIAEAIIGAVLAGGAYAMRRGPHRARTIGLLVNGFAIVGFLNGLTFTVRSGRVPDIAYHVLVLPILITSFVVVFRSPADATRRESENEPPPDQTARPTFRITWLRRTSFAALLLVLMQYGLGMAVNLYVTLPADDRTISDGISNGPATLTVHIVLGLLLVLAAIAVVMQAVIAHDAKLAGSSTVALAALIVAAGSGSSFLDSGDASASMAMAIATAVAVIAYATNLFLLIDRRRTTG